MTHPLVQLLDTLRRAPEPAAPTSPPHHGNGSRRADRRRANGHPATATPFDQGRQLLMLFEEMQRIDGTLIRMFVQPYLRAQLALLQQAAGSHAAANGKTGGRKDDEDELFEMLSRLQLWVLQHPIAAQAMFSSLVAEGRHFAGTDAGARWARLFADSELVRKGRLIWEATTLNLLEERQGSVLPTAYLEVLRRAITAKDFESLLARLRQGIGGPHL